jgi:CPA2 family monovalent cation:H+ antiporter-2
LITRIFRYGNVIPLAAGLGLFQVGEFSFVLAGLGLSTGSIDQELYSLVLTVAILTMALTPLVSGQTARLYSLKRRMFRREPLEKSNIPGEGLHSHVVIAGGGRVGLQIARVLHRLGFSSVIIELDHRRVEQARAAGLPVIYGDASHEVVLDAAAITSARMLIVTTPEMVVTQAIVTNARKRNSGLDVVARTSDPTFLPVFKRLDVTDVVLPEFEASLEMTRQALLHLRVPAPDIQRHTESIRHDLFAPFFSPNDRYRTLGRLRTAELGFDLQWVVLGEDSPLVARSIGEAEIRKVTGASVVGVLRSDDLRANPDADLRFQQGDLVAIIGTDEARRAFQEMAVPATE